MVFLYDEYFVLIIKNALGGYTGAPLSHFLVTFTSDFPFLYVVNADVRNSHSP